MENTSHTYFPGGKAPEPAPVVDIAQRDSSKTTILLVLLLVAVSTFVAGGGYYFWQKNAQTQATQAEFARQAAAQPKGDPTIEANNDPRVTTTVDSWNAYHDVELKFSLAYPNEYLAETVDGQTYLDRKISWHTSEVAVKDLAGNTSTITSQESSEISGTKVTKYSVTFEKESGAVPHEEVWYELENPQPTTPEEKYILFTLSALPSPMTKEEEAAYKLQTAVQKLTPEEVTVFEKIVQTVKFE